MTGERGSASFAAIGLLPLVLLMAAVATGWAGVLDLRTRAAAASDQAALAGAMAHQTATDPCLAAQRLARANGATAIGCDLDGSVVRVIVQMTGEARLLGRTVAVTVSARAAAGPAGRAAP
jgi:secretion/DNA translocation related TadE-like protein